MNRRDLHIYNGREEETNVERNIYVGKVWIGLGYNREAFQTVTKRSQ